LLSPPAVRCRNVEMSGGHALQNVRRRDFFGVPRRMYRTAAAEVFAKVKHLIKRRETASLTAENQTVVFAGYFYGRNLRGSRLDKPLQFFAKRFFNSADR
ncbi:MAG: hypothetical protein LH472_14945, partial [Pyrinomonadaceae bacterium]|nr:hypothetical protein [Pyrinomonadaceae bacterium]